MHTLLRVWRGGDFVTAPWPGGDEAAKGRRASRAGRHYR
jgi:hypothetical protein